jgi:transposase-like protein
MNDTEWLGWTPARTRLDASQKKRIAERYTAGETMAELAREYEC